MLEVIEKLAPVQSAIWPSLLPRTILLVVLVYAIVVRAVSHEGTPFTILLVILEEALKTNLAFAILQQSISMHQSIFILAFVATTIGPGVLTVATP